MPSCVVAHSWGGDLLRRCQNTFFINSCMRIRQTDFKLLLVHHENFYFIDLEIFPSLIWQRIDIVWLIKCACADGNESQIFIEFLVAVRQNAFGKFDFHRFISLLWAFLKLIIQFTAVIFVIVSWQTRFGGAKIELEMQFIINKFHRRIISNFTSFEVEVKNEVRWMKKRRENSSFLSTILTEIHRSDASHGSETNNSKMQIVRLRN